MEFSTPKREKRCLNVIGRRVGVRGLWKRLEFRVWSLESPTPKRAKRCSRLMIDSGRGAARAENTQGAPTQSQISPSIQVYEDWWPRRGLATAEGIEPGVIIVKTNEPTTEIDIFGVGFVPWCHTVDFVGFVVSKSRGLPD